MSVEILLISKVDGLGIEGDVVKVSAGYARNYLFPKGYATIVTEGLKRQVEKKRVERIKLLEEEKVIAVELASKIEALECKIEAKIGDNGKLFGSVGISQLIDYFEQNNISIQKNKIKLHSPISELGSSEVIIKLHPEVDAILKVEIIAEK